MENRNIKLKLLTQTALEVINTNARTISDLKAEISKSESLIRKFGISDANQLSNVDFVDRDTKAILSIDSAVLPATDCILFVSLRKNKFGAGAIQLKSKKEVEAMSYNAVRSYASLLNKEFNAGISMLGSRAAIADGVISFISSQSVSECETCDCNCEKPNFIEEVARKLEQATMAISAAKEMLNMLEEIHAENDEEGVVIHLTEEDLQLEAEELKHHLGR
jgi:hypothetical protein